MSDATVREEVVVWQEGHLVIGLGPALEAATADAREWMGEPVDPEDLTQHRSVPRIEAGRMYAGRCTPRLADAVRSKGGDVRCGMIRGGVVDLLED